MLRSSTRAHVVLDAEHGSEPPTMSAASAASAPSYPSSNRKQVDWDKVDKEVSEELEGEKLEGDAALNKLFQDIYGRADEVRTRPSVALGAH